MTQPLIQTGNHRAVRAFLRPEYSRCALWAAQRIVNITHGDKLYPFQLRLEAR